MQLNDFVYCYALLFFASLVGGVVLEPTVNYFRVAAELTGLNLFVYWAHRLIHWLPSWASPHLAWHHDHALGLPRPLELFLEFWTNLSWFAALWFIQKLAGVKVFHDSLIAFIGIWYASMHVINMSLFENSYHPTHHVKRDVNYGPPYMDQLFGTFLHDGCYDVNSSVLNGFVSVLIVETLRRYFHVQL